MANLNCCRKSYVARELRPLRNLSRKHFAVRYSLGLAVVVFAASVQAAPVTLQFEATVGPPRQGVDAPLPPSWTMSLQQGDTISGTFVFEPFDAAPNTTKTTLVQPFDFSIHIKNRTLTTSQYGIEVFNNITSDEVPEPRDRISLGCSAGVNTPSCVPAIISAPESLHWTFLLGLEANASVLEGADIPPDPTVWRQLVFRDSFGVTFTDNQALRTYGFIASPITFEAIPEPISFVLAIFGTVLLTLFARVPARPQSSLCIRR